MTVIVVGAGIAGLACARELVDAGVPARVVERAGVVGGRLASEPLGGRTVDTGAAYLTADHPAFLGRLQTWRIDGLARPWTDTFRGQHGAAPMRWSAPGGLRSLAVDLARELDVTLGAEVTALPRADAVVLAMPGPEALRIADLPAAREQSWSPVLTAVLTYPDRVWPDFHGVFVNDHPVLATVCDDGDRRGDRAPVLVAHSTAEFARGSGWFSAPSEGPGAGSGTARGSGWFSAPSEGPGAGSGTARERRPDDAAGVEMAAAVGALLELGDPVGVTLRRWPFAQPRPGTGRFAVRDGVYLCGDAFGRPRVQTAWLSGLAAARAILQSTRLQSTVR